MKKLKIDPEFRDLLPPLPKEKFDGLEQMILKDGYDGTPIIIWNGYIVDGHHRYKIFTKHGIRFKIKKMSILEYAQKSNVMMWIIKRHNIGRDNYFARRIYTEKRLYDKINEERGKLYEKTKRK